MRLKIVKYNKISESAYLDYIEEWELSGERIVPWAAGRENESFQDLLSRWATEESDEIYKKGLVPSTLYFLVDKRRILGAIHFRHELNDDLLQNGGHIGYGIRPSERRKGYAGKMLLMLLETIRSKGYKKVLITCDESNLASAKVIENANGILHDKIEFEGETTRRYWVNLDAKEL